jgi:hypothetical protein
MSQGRQQWLDSWAVEVLILAPKLHVCSEIATWRIASAGEVTTVLAATGPTHGLLSSVNDSAGDEPQDFGEMVA